MESQPFFKAFEIVNPIDIEIILRRVDMYNLVCNSLSWPCLLYIGSRSRQWIEELQGFEPHLIFFKDLVSAQGWSTMLLIFEFPYQQLIAYCFYLFLLPIF